MQYLSLAPSEALRPWVRCCWTLEDAAPSGPATIVPDGCAELVLHLGHLPRRRAAGPATVAPRAFLVTTVDRPVTLHPDGPLCVAGIRFEPGGQRPWFPAPLHSLGDGVEVTALLGEGRTRRLLERLSDAATPAVRLAILETTLLRWRQPDRLATGPEHAIRRLLAESHTLDGATIAERTGLSQRTLQRLARERLGTGIKRIARVFRFQRAARRLVAGAPVSLTRLAADTGYADYPHMARDFREFSGQTPAGLLAGRAPIGEAFLRDGVGMP